MLKNYFITAFRNLLKYKVHSVVNIVGLAVGIAISILILTLVHDELSYDRFNENWQRIYRINRVADVDGTLMDGALTPIALKETVLGEIPEVKESVRLLKGSHKKVSYGDIHLSAENFYYADDSYFRVFTIPLIKGDPDLVLRDKFSIVLTESTAARYFSKDEDPIGKILELDNGWKFRVTGICRDVPENSHYHFDYLASLNGIFDDYEKEKWLAEIVSTYILASDDKSGPEIEACFPGIVERYIMKDLRTYMGENALRFTDNDTYKFYLQPLSKIHLDSKSEGEFEAGTDRIYIYVFITIALLILVIACVNFMNLSTAKSAARAKEVAIRKVSGATRRQISLQFLSESVIYTFLALGLSFVVLELMLRPFNAYTGKSLDIFYFSNLWLIPVFLGGAILVGIFSGSYPALYLSSFKVINILKGRNFEGMYSTRLRGFLVLSQFTVSIVLFISSMIIIQQVRYFRQSNPGFNRNNIVVVQRAYALQDRGEEFKKLLLKNPRINAASVSVGIPGRSLEQYPFRVDSLKEGRILYIRPMEADYDFMHTMQMHLVAGNYFEKDDSESSILINETAAREMGVMNPVGVKISGIGITGSELQYTVRGIVKDYHFESFRQEIKPLAIGLMPKKAHPQYLSIRISGDQTRETLAYIRTAWNKFVKDEPFDYYLLDKYLDSMYDEEETTAHIFTIFTLLAIFIAVLGLLGLASHSAEQRTREIGIRKAMGATTPRITMMLSVQFTKWAIWANLLAFPVAYLGMKLWLGKFYYHINMEAWLFFLGAVLALLIALVTVIYQATHSAGASPVEALQYE